MSQFYDVQIPQNRGELAGLVVRYSEPSDPVYQKGALVYCGRFSYREEVDRLESSIAGIPCIGIEFEALNDCELEGERETYTPTSIECIPDGIRWIGDRVFTKWQNSHIQLPDSIEYLGQRCFSSSRIERITLPSKLKSIGRGCFFGSSIKEIDVPGSLKTIPDYCFFSYDLEKICIDEGVSRIGENSLFGGAGIEGKDKRVVFLPRSVSFIEKNALGRDGFKGIVYAYSDSG